MVLRKVIATRAAAASIALRWRAPVVSHIWKDKLMDRTNTSKDHPDFKAALILAVLVPICLWPVVWDTSAIVQYLTPYSQ